MKFFVFSNVFFGALMLTTVCGVGSAKAEDTNSRPFHGRRIEALKQQLDLTDDQANKLGEIFASRRGRCAQETDEAARRECRKQNFSEGKKQMEAILTPEQLDKFRSLREAWRAKKMECRQAQGVSNGGPSEHLN